MLRIGSLAALLAILRLATSGLCVYYQLNTQTLNPKNVVVKEALRIAIKDLGFPRYSELTQGGTIIILENDQITDVTMPRDVSGTRIQLLSREAIDAKVTVEGPFQYLVLKEVNVYDNTALVTYYLTGVFDSGAGGSINLTLRDGVWVGEGGIWWIA